MIGDPFYIYYIAIFFIPKKINKVSGSILSRLYLLLTITNVLTMQYYTNNIMNIIINLSNHSCNKPIESPLVDFKIEINFVKNETYFL